MHRSLFGLMLAGFTAGFLLAQAPTIRVATNLVLTPVSVADSGGKPIPNLKSEDFEIEENGVRVAAARLGKPGEAPFQLAMLFDMSGSVYSRFEFERQAAARFLTRIMRPSDSVFIVSVANEPKILQETTSSLEVALQAVAKLSPTTQATAFYNSLAKAAQMLRETERPEVRRVIVAISDGEDNRSLDNTFSDVLKQLQLTNCLFYSINPSGRAYSTGYFGRRAQESMETLANQTGGASFVADNVEELSEFYSRIADELQGQYLLGYYSPATTGPAIYRRIAIRIPGRPDLQVKARHGYYPK
jgi:VWFA-related protein